MFNTNNLGGWIIPAGTEIAAETGIPSYSEIGDGCTIGDRCKIGNYCTIGDRCTIGNYCTIGNDCTIGNYCTIGDGCKIGDDCTIGYGCKIGNYCTIGDGCKIGDDCTWLGVKVKSWLTLANVDGSNRQIKIVRSDEGEIKIEAGCFIGTLDEFIAKAKSEGKLRYVAVISAIAEHV
jgi:NDP-sugar pyrophosphorylase family protein